jgi:hypothetical protein
LEEPVLNGEKMGLEFEGGSGRVNVRDEDCSVVGVGGYGGIRGGGNVSCIKEVQERPEDTALGYAGVDRGQGGVRSGNFNEKVPLVEIGLKKEEVIQREGSS